MTALDLAPHAEKIARALLGKPNLDLSQKNPAGDWIELRYRTKGALAIPINGDKASTYYDHEAKAGGSLLGLICREEAWTEAEAFAWLHDELGIGDGPRADAKYRITGTWVYRDRDGEPLYRVVRRDAEGKPKKIHRERYDPATGTFSGKKGCMKGPDRRGREEGGRAGEARMARHLQRRWRWQVLSRLRSLLCRYPPWCSCRTTTRPAGTTCAR